jgi:spermidine/putrescine-binding protein
MGEANTRDSDGLSRRSFLHKNLILGGAVVASGSLAGLLSACGGSGSDSTSGAAITAADLKAAKGTIKGYGWGSEFVPKMNAGPVKAKWTEIGGDAAQIPTKIKPAGSFDVFTSNAGQMNQYFAIDRLAPIDTSLLTNYGSVNKTLREDPAWRGEDGKIYAVPLILGSALMAWNSKDVAEPKSLQDLLKPEYEGAIGLYDDYQMIATVAQGLGLPQPPNLTKDHLAQIKEYLEELRPQVKTFYPFGGEAQLFGRGDIAVAYNTFASLIVNEKKSDPNLRTSYLSSVTYADALSILAGDNEVEALAWIDQVLALPAMTELAEFGQAPTSVEAANVGLSKEVAPELSELAKLSPFVGPFPVEDDGDKVTVQEATASWSEYKASF